MMQQKSKEDMNGQETTQKDSSGIPCSFRLQTNKQ